MAGHRGPLALLAVAMLLTLVATPLMFLAWTLALAALLWLARDEDHRRPALAAVALLILVVAIALPLSGVSIGWQGRALARLGTSAGDAEGVFASAAIVAAPAATALYLALAPVPTRSRTLARWAAAAFAVALAAGLLVLRGEKIAGIAGLAGLAGLATLVLVLAAMAAAFLASDTARVT